MIRGNMKIILTAFIGQSAKSQASSIGGTWIWKTAITWDVLLRSNGLGEGLTKRLISVMNMGRG